jgi:hypothetical protein
MENQNQRWKQLEQQLIEKAMKDEQFRRQLVNHPRETIEKEMGIRIPENLSIKILEEDINTLYLILPSVPDQESGSDLTEADLQSIAGGIGSYGVESTRDVTCVPDAATFDPRCC